MRGWSPSFLTPKPNSPSEGPVVRPRPWKRRPSSIRKEVSWWGERATPRKGRDGGRAFRENGGRNRQPTRPESPPRRREPRRPRQPEGVRPRSLGTRNLGVRTPPIPPQRTHALTTGGRLHSRHLSRTQAHTTEALPPPAPVAGVEALPASAPLRPQPGHELASRGQASPLRVRALGTALAATPP